MEEETKRPDGEVRPGEQGGAECLASSRHTAASQLDESQDEVEPERGRYTEQLSSLIDDPSLRALKSESGPEVPTPSEFN